MEEVISDLREEELYAPVCGDVNELNQALEDKKYIREQEKVN